MTKPIGRLTTITDWGNPNRRLESNLHGRVTYGQWCQLEANRINDNGDMECEVKTNRHGEVAVAPVALQVGP